MQYHNIVTREFLTPPPLLEETIVEYLDNQYPNLSLAESEYVLKVSEKQLEQYILKKIGKNKVVKFHQEIPFNLPQTAQKTERKIPESSKLLRKAIITSANS